MTTNDKPALAAAIEAILLDSDIKSAIVDMLKANTPPKPSEQKDWFEVWHQRSEDVRLLRYDDLYADNRPVEVRLFVTAAYSERGGVGNIRAQFEPKGWRGYREEWHTSGETPFPRIALATFEYPDVIRKAQDAWDGYYAKFLEMTEPIGDEPKKDAE